MKFILNANFVFQFRALYDYTAHQWDELSFAANDILTQYKVNCFKIHQNY